MAIQYIPDTSEIDKFSSLHSLPPRKNGKNYGMTQENVTFSNSNFGDDSGWELKLETSQFPMQ